MKFLLVSLLALAGCAPIVKPVVVPQIVTQTVTKIVPVPDELTAPCAIAQRASNRVMDVVDAFNQRGDALAACNKRMQQIRDLGAPSQNAQP